MKDMNKPPGASWLDQPGLVLEVVPPPLGSGEEALARRLDRIDRILKAAPIQAVNIPEIHDETSKSDRGKRKGKFEERMEPRVLAKRIQERSGVPAVINRVVVHLERDKQADWFRETSEVYGVQNFILVGGEKSAQAYPGPSVREANALIRESISDPQLSVGNISIPSRNSGNVGEEARMSRKAEAGVDFFTTQIVYHPDEFTGLLDAMASHHPELNDTPLFLSLCPIKGLQSLPFLRWLGVTVRDSLEETFRACESECLLDASVDYLVEAWRGICDHRTTRALPHPVGVNLAAVGPIPTRITVDLARRLAEVGI